MDKKDKPYKPDLSQWENQGWKAMHELLDIHMPVEEKKRRVVPLYWRWLAAAAVLALIAIPVYRYLSLGIKQATVAGVAPRHPAAPVVSTPQQEGKNPASSANPEITDMAAGHNAGNKQGVLKPGRSSLTGEKTSLALNNPSSANPLSVAPLRRPVSFGMLSPKRDNISAGMVAKKREALPMAGDSLPSYIAVNAGRTDAITGSSTDSLSASWTDKAVARVAAKKNSAPADSSVNKDNNKKLPPMPLAYTDPDAVDTKKESFASAKQVGLAVLMNRNIDNSSYSSGNQLYDLPVYPAVTASIKVNALVGFTAGISAIAPGNFNAPTATASSSIAAMSVSNKEVSGASKNGKMVSALNTMSSAGISSGQNIRQAYYWQVPLMVDIWPLSHFKLSAGTDLAFVQRVLVGQSDGSMQLMSYSAYSNNAPGVQVKQFDPRLTLGAQYQFRRFSLGARFSRSFQPSVRLDGSTGNGLNNQIINLSLGFRLFK